MPVTAGAAMLVPEKRAKGYERPWKVREPAEL